MLTSSKFTPDITETPEQFGMRYDAARRSSRQAARVLRGLRDTNAFEGMSAGDAHALADAASMFPEDAVAELPEAAAPSRELMMRKMLEPYATYRMEAARAPAYAMNQETSMARVEGAYAALAKCAGVMPSDIAESKGGLNSSHSYVEAISKFYR